MIIEPFIVPALVAVAVIGSLTLLLNVIGSMRYDLQLAKAHQHYRRQPHIRIYRHRPLVSLIITTHNDAAVIERCLDSVRFSEYRKFQIVVIDDCSQDGTVAIIERWMAAHPRRAVRLIARRKPSTQLSSLRIASRRHLQGELILVLAASSVLDEQALTRAVRHYNYRPTIDILLPNRSGLANLTITGLFERYTGLLGQRRQKLNSVAQADNAPNLQAAIYRKAAFRQLLHLQRQTQPAGQLSYLCLTDLGRQWPYCYYASDVIVQTAAPGSFAALLVSRYRLQLSRRQALRAGCRFFSRPRAPRTWLAWCLLPVTVTASLLILLIPLLISYFIYLAVGLHEPLLLGLSAVILAGLLLTAIWGDQSLKLRQKLAYIIGIPVTYGLFYLTACLQLLLIPALILRGKQLRVN